MSDLINRIIEEINRKIDKEENNSVPGDDLSVGIVVGLEMAMQIIKEQSPTKETDVYIKGMEMPYSCLDCDFSKVQTYDSTIRCCVPSEESFGENVIDYVNVRAQFCPLLGE